MSQTRSSNRDSVVPDEYPVRPSSMLKNELRRLNSKIEKTETYTLVILSSTYFIFGCGIGIYGPLYPQEAKSHSVKTYIYGPAMAVNFLASILFYPIACRMVPSITCRQSLCTSIFMIGISKVLFGTLALISEKIPFVILSYGIQVVEGVGIAVLLASTLVTVFSQVTEKTDRNIGAILAFLILGLAIGAICGEAAYDAFSYSVPFYGIGVLTVLDAIVIAILLPEPDQRLSTKEIPVLSWTKKPRMWIYFLIVFTTLNYTGFLIVVLEPYLRQFHLNKVFVGALFSIPPFACGLSAPGWKWVTKKGVNSILLICISSILIFASLVLIGPAPFTSLDASLANVSTALLLNGLGIGGKMACATYAASRDMKSIRSLNGVNDPLLLSTMFAFGSLLGCFSGSIAAGFTYFYLGMVKTTYILLGLEAITFAVSFVFAFNRNYRSPRHPGEFEEGQPILVDA